MNAFKSIILASALAGAIGLAGASSASALSLNLGGVAPATMADGNLIQQVQRRGGRAFRGGAVRRGGIARRGPAVRAFRGGPRAGYVRRGGRWVPGAAIGLGILGAAAIAGAASRPYYDGDYGDCWVERRPIYNNWGEYVGSRRIRVCN